MRPIVLPSNQPRDRFYQGGTRISAFRGVQPSPPNTPEDWVASTVAVRDHAPVGMTRLPSGELLADAIEHDPIAWFGPAHVAAFGTDPMILVKLLDPGQRLPVHAHPSDAFAAARLGAAHGKAEAWYILEPGTVWMGFHSDVDPRELRALVDAQDTSALLALLNRVEVKAHDIVFVPTGVFHAIGEGVVLVEAQQPEDLSILIEWEGFDLDGPNNGHLGLGFDAALQAIDYSAFDPSPHIGSTLATEKFFRFEPYRGAGETQLEAGFAVVVVTDGSAQLAELALNHGATVVIPHAAGALPLKYDGAVIVVRPPAAS